MRNYLDSSVVIYWVEKVPNFYPKVDAHFKRPDVILVSSHLTWMESLVLPLRNKNIAVQQDFDQFFSTQVTELVPFTQILFRHAAQIRAEYNFRTPDSLHLAAAVAANCDVFYTNDIRLQSFGDIAVEVVA
jgi:predicted nucleic acid-binding protein